MRKKQFGVGTKNLNRDTNLVLVALGMFFFVLPTFLYQYSELIGWTSEKGYELEALFVLAGLMLLHVTASVFWKPALKTLPVWLGLLVGIFVPWTLNDPWWSTRPPPPDETGLVAESSSPNELMVTRVAHAAGSLNGSTYTNSLEALELNSQYYEFFEIDLSRTADGDLVCVHDWESFWRNFGSVESFSAPSSAKFVELTSDGEVTPCDLNSLRIWSERNPDKHIILDVKVTDSVKAYEEIADALGPTTDRFIPQIYFPDDYVRVNNHDWAGIIWTQYRKPFNLQKSLEYWEEYELLAITLPKERIAGFINPGYQEGVILLAHTVNDFKSLAEIKDLGVSEVYTDFLRVP